MTEAVTGPTPSQVRKRRWIVALPYLGVCVVADLFLVGQFGYDYKTDMRHPDPVKWVEDVLLAGWLVLGLLVGYLSASIRVALMPALAFAGLLVVPQGSVHWIDGMGAAVMVLAIVAILCGLTGASIARFRARRRDA